ncbi:hypothetical protein SORDD30_00159 [Streptococcus oralis]|uniref:DUF551 domain-containing protein n=1 Tax=Streptococcus oralis TaxID=1303 RepID=A0A139QE17_STROR|nr:hypothetical protein [Streptococcus oralis]KXU00777.1 hypothetical protein SORDD30_00159 [Streptococcus oralis]
MKNTDWKKITQRPLTSEEKKEYGDEVEFMWDGKTPELDEEVLVYTSESEEVYTDIWVDFNDGIGFENTCSNVIYWMSFPKPLEITVTYPRFVDVDRNGVFQKVFETSNGNEEWCSPTGRELQEGPDVMDHWLEYEDSEGELHYGR